MSLLELNTSGLRSHDRLDAWSAAIAEAFGPFGIARDHACGFHGRLRVERREDIRFVELSYAGHGFRRRRSDVARLGESYYSLLRPLSGRLLHASNGEEHILEPGRFYVVNNGAPYDTMAQSRYETLGLAFPPAALETRAGLLKPFYELRAEPDSPRYALLDSFVAHFAAGRSQWTGREFDRLSNQLLDLIVLAIIEPGQGIAANETCARAAHRARALRHIRARLGDRGLTPATVAEACGVSRAYLHEIFRAGGAGIEETIVAERLDRARAILTTPAAAGLQIAAIAYRVGFGDPAHFSRVFRRRFGHSPREARPRCAEPPLGQ